jgi:hypothetical protein
MTYMPFDKKSGDLVGSSSSRMPEVIPIGERIGAACLRGLVSHSGFHSRLKPAIKIFAVVPAAPANTTRPVYDFPLRTAKPAGWIPYGSVELSFTIGEWSPT